MKSFLLAAIFLLLTQSLSHAQPVTRFGQITHDFGNVSETDEAKYDFEFSNAGDEDLMIEKVVASSGRTKAVASSNIVKPGEKAFIRVILDLRGEKGIFSRTIAVHTNDPIIPVTTLSVKITVKDRIHMAQYKAAEIFAGECKGCHVDQGVGKKGWDLFKADCFMCHNAGKKTSLSTMSKKPAEELFKSIREGVDNTLMPGFHLDKGGPLNDEEIKSLIELIKS
jgi:cytochrome c553